MLTKGAIMKSTFIILIAVLIAGCATADTAKNNGRLASVEIITNRGEVRTAYRDGHTFFSAPIGCEYSIIVRNRTGRRIVAITTVDGLNVVDRSKGNWDGSGYVIDPYGKVEIKGFRRQDEFQFSERFTFNEARFSLAQRIGNVHNVGVIGVAVFEEYVPPPPQPIQYSAKGMFDDECARESASAPTAMKSRAGTEAGRTVNDPVRRVNFRRATDQPAEILAMFYDTESNLISQGILPPPYDPPPSGFLSPFPQNYAKGAY